MFKFPSKAKLSRNSPTPATGPQSSGKQPLAHTASTTRIPSGSAIKASGGNVNGSAGPTPSPSRPTQGVGNNTLNVILCGDMGVGKSALVNLIAQKEVAGISSDVHRCTMHATPHDIPIDDVHFRIFDTVGLGESAIGSNDYINALEKAYELVLKLGNAGGVHLLLFAMRGGRITSSALNNYRLFVEVMCQARVPVALVFTGLENESVMDNWWTRNMAAIEQRGIKSDAHACVTTVQEKVEKYMESKEKIRALLKGFYPARNEGFMPEPKAWFAQLGGGMQAFLKTDRKSSRKDIIKMLTQRCKLDSETAKRVADMMERAADAQSNGPQK